jgi:hypothetical protein
LRATAAKECEEEGSGLTGVGDQDLDVLHAMRAVDTDLLVEDEALVEVRVRKLSALLLDDLNVVEVGRTLCVGKEEGQLASRNGRGGRTGRRRTFNRRTALTASSAK